MLRLLTRAIAIVAAVFALGCNRPLTSNDAGMSGSGGVRIMTGGGGGLASGTAGATGGGGAGPATDAGSDRSSCVAVCGQVAGVLADPPGSCTFPLLCAHPPGFTGLVVFVDGQTVPQDSIAGWDYTDGTRSAIRITDPFCATVMTANAPVDVDFLCEVN